MYGSNHNDYDRQKDLGENFPIVAAASSTVEDDPVTRSLKLLDVIRSAIKAGDVETIRQTGDALKGCITSVLAKEALIAASALEKTEHEDDLGRAQDAVNASEQPFESASSRVCVIILRIDRSLWSRLR